MGSFTDCDESFQKEDMLLVSYVKPQKRLVLPLEEDEEETMDEAKEESVGLEQRE